MASERMSGTVKWFSRVKGYGFIAPDGEEREIFVHFSGIEGEGYRNLEKGEKVSFVVEDTEKGPQAVNVRAEGFDVTSWTAEPTDDPAEGPGGETSWRAEEEEVIDEAPESEISGEGDEPSEEAMMEEPGETDEPSEEEMMEEHGEADEPSEEEMMEEHGEDDEPSEEQMMEEPGEDDEPSGEEMMEEPGEGDEPPDLVA